jgi:hypothetical protein
VTETTTTINPEAARGTPRLCQMGRPTSQCWREATDRLIDDNPDYDVCAEHFRAHQLGRALDPLHDALVRIGEWIAEVEGMADKGEPSWDPPLLEYGFHMCEKAYADYWRANVAREAAYLIAIQGEDEEPLSTEQAERIGELLLRAEEFDRVQRLLEAQGEWPLAVAIAAAQKAISEELERYQREIGRR